MDPLDILIRYRKVRRHRDFTCASLLKTTSGCRRSTPASIIGPAKFPERAYRPAVAGANREPQDHIPWSSLLALPQSYISRAAVLAKPTIGIPISPCWGGGKWSGRFAEMHG